MVEARHRQAETGASRSESTPRGSAVTRSDEISASNESIVVHVPEEPPGLTSRAARTLLGILVELNTVVLLDEPPEGARRDC